MGDKDTSQLCSTTKDVLFFCSRSDLSAFSISFFLSIVSGVPSSVTLTSNCPPAEYSVLGGVHSDFFS